MARMKPARIAMVVLLAGCASTPSPHTDGIARARFGETAYVDGPRVTPLAIVEDSRCPHGVRCVWAGRLRITARIDLGSGSQTRELTLHKPEAVADGTLELVEATPYPTRDRVIEGTDYRFGFRFMGGL